MNEPTQRRDKSKQQPRRELKRGVTRQVGTLLPTLTRRALGKHGFSSAALVADWQVIVGAEVAENCQPEKLVFPRSQRSGGILHIRTSSVFALELQHIEPLIVERINAFLGYAAISRLKLIQAPRSRRTAGPAVAPQAVAPPGANSPSHRTEPNGPASDGPGAQSLQASLERLGRAIQQNESKRKK